MITKITKSHVMPSERKYKFENEFCSKILSVSQNYTLKISIWSCWGAWRGNSVLQLIIGRDDNGTELRLNTVLFRQEIYIRD